MINLDLLERVFAEHFPIKSDDGLAELVYCNLEEREEGALGVVVRLVQMERAGELRQIRDIKEQSVYVPVTGLDLPTLARIRELVAAMAKVLPRALASPELDYAMPHDLLTFGPLAKKTFKSEADFVPALERELASYLTKPA